jgi:hypothetical protein
MTNEDKIIQNFANFMTSTDHDMRRELVIRDYSMMILKLAREQQERIEIQRREIENLKDSIRGAGRNLLKMVSE